MPESEFMSEFKRSLDGMAIDAPKDQRDCCRSVVRQIDQLTKYTLHFENAVQLFSFSESRLNKITPNLNQEQRKTQWDTFFGWQLIAGRDAAMTLHHIDIVTDAIVKGVRLCSHIKEGIDLVHLDKIQPLFSKHFPRATRMRNAVGHSAGSFSNPRKTEANASSKLYEGPGIVDAGIGTVISGNIEDRRYTETISGETVFVEVSDEWLLHLVEIVDTTYLAFLPLAVANGFKPPAINQPT
jgi:hypothetical protein